MARMRTYLRPHKNNAPDALQYTPSFSGADTNWQLVHRPRGTAPSPTQNTEEGIAVEIVFEGRNAAIFIGDDTEPALRVPRLALEPRTGRLTFWSSIMQPTEHELPVVLENIRVRPSSSRAIPAADPLVAPDGVGTGGGVPDQRVGRRSPHWCPLPGAFGRAGRDAHHQPPREATRGTRRARHHCRHRGGSRADDYRTGSMAALAGGITTISTFAFPARGQTLAQAVDRTTDDRVGRCLVQPANRLPDLAPCRRTSWLRGKALKRIHRYLRAHGTS